ncbi:UNKNOWN [Stylonychia lemnae]|uniref:EamA domain-containing protein n=1 Tax=Stylonychia lemnae TaxID=5949 RepID=A0A077ZYX3_STYLE|nr:UNKNOWN [Stylonychia lemnae]|eukprot:CDW75156.1 UNKNOWN [Stylonychia lemnae]
MIPNRDRRIEIQNPTNEMQPIIFDEIHEENMIQYDSKEFSELQSFVNLRKQITEQNSWLIYSVMGAISLASHNYIISVQMNMKNNSSYIYSECFSFITFPLCYHALQAYNTWQSRGKFWTKDKSQLTLISNREKIDIHKIILLIFRGILQVMIPLNTALIAFYAIKVDMSVGAMYSIVTLASFFIAFTFYILYKEKLLVRHIVGMVLMIFGVISIAVSKSRNQDMTISPQLIIPIMLCLLQCTFLTVCAVILRQVTKRGYDSIQFSQDSFLVAGIFYLILFIYSQTVFPGSITTQKIIILTLAGAFLILGSTFQNVALKSGRGGVVMAIIQCQSLFQFVFEIFLQFRVPNIFEITSLSLSTVGVIIASLKDNQ